MGHFLTGRQASHVADIEPEPWMRAKSTKFYENLGQFDVFGAVADTARQLTPGLGARPCTSETSGDAGPSQPISVDFREFFDVEPDAPSIKVPRLPPSRTYVTEMSATQTNVTVRHTSHEMSTMPGYRSHLRSSTTSRPRSHLSTVYMLGHSSPHSSVQEWLHQVTAGAPPPTPTVVTSQAVSELPLGATASALAPPRSRSSRHSHGTRCSRRSSRPSVTPDVLDFTSTVKDNLLQVAQSFRIDANNREEAQNNEALAWEQCHHQQAERRENALKQEAMEREQRQSQEATKREENLLRDVALCEERLQKDAQAQRSNAFAREEVLLRARSEAKQKNLTREKAYLDTELK